MSRSSGNDSPRLSRQKRELVACAYAGWPQGRRGLAAAWYLLLALKFPSSIVDCDLEGFTDPWLHLASKRLHSRGTLARELRLAESHGDSGHSGVLGIALRVQDREVQCRMMTSLGLSNFIVPSLHFAHRPERFEMLE